jgi:predicted RND superfamily exporter protein
VFLEHLRDEIRPLERREGLSVQLAGAEFEGYQMSTGMTDGMMRSTLVTVLVCTLIVILLMRSVKLGLITALPIVLTTGWILGLMYVLGYSLNMVTASITAMTVGVGMDFSIHIMERYREERRSGRLVRPAIERTLSTTGVSLVVAASTTLFGFLVIGTSDIAMFRTFGILSAMMIVLSMVSAMVVLPAKIVLLERDGPISRGSKLEEGGEPFVRAVDPDGRVPSVPVTAEVYSRAVKTN